MLTWGLLGPGKGIEWAIDAFAELDDLDPAPTYMIAGATHPKVRERAGESYREMLVDRAARSGPGRGSAFDDSYRDLEVADRADPLAPTSWCCRTTPTTRSRQACWSTPSPPDDPWCRRRSRTPSSCSPAEPGSSSRSVIRQRWRRPSASVLTDAERAQAMAAEARRLAPELSWAAVAGRYDAVAAELLADRMADGAVPA